MQYIFILGGWDGEVCRSDVAIYSPDGAPAGHLAPNARRMLAPRDALASAFVEGDVIAMGGTDGSNYLASCEIYTASTPGTGRSDKPYIGAATEDPHYPLTSTDRYTSWTYIPSMGTTRAFHAASPIRRKIYVTGGQGSQSGAPGAYGEARQRESQVLESIEYMDMDSETWFEGPPMPGPRTMHSGVSSEQRVYAIGGRNGKFEHGEVLNTAIAWDPREKDWQTLDPMRTKRFGSGVAYIDGSVCVFGGKDGDVPLATVERYDERAGKWDWDLIPDMANERVFSRAVVMGSFIFVIAGYNRTNELLQVEEWSHSTSRWRCIDMFRLHTIEEDITKARQDVAHIEDEIYLLEMDYKMQEAQHLRNVELPVLQRRLELVNFGKLSPWRGGPPRDSLLGMRHISAENVMPGSTVEMFKERAREEQAREAMKSKGSEADQRDAERRARLSKLQSQH